MRSQDHSSSTEPAARNAGKEAEGGRGGGRYETRVLAPSLPAATEPPWFADDPTTLEEGSFARPVVSPVSGGDILWDELARSDVELAQWCACRWLGAWSR